MTEDNATIEVTIGEFAVSVSGSEEFVEKQFWDLHEQQNIGDLEVGEIDARAQTPESRDGSEGGKVESGDEIDKALNEILLESDISMAKDKAMLVGWYIEKVEGEEDFTGGEVREAADRHKVDLGANVGRDLDYKVEDGHLSVRDRDGEDAYWVTGTGLNYLEEKGILV